MSNKQPKTKQQFEAVSTPEGLPPLRLRLVVGGIVTVVALTEFGASKPARADHETEEGDKIDCDYGFHAGWWTDHNEDGQPGPGPEEYACFTRKDCAVARPLIALPEGAPDLTRQQRLDLAAGSKMQCRGDPYPNYDEWFEAHPWAQPMIIEEEATTPEDSTTETEPDQPEPVVEPVTEPEATEDTSPEEEVVDEQQPDTGTTTTETEPDQPEPVVEPTEPETTSTTALVEQQPPDTETDTDTSVLPDVLVVGTIGAVALSSIYLFKAKKIKIPSRLKRNPRR